MRQRAKGLTLIEMMVVLAIAGLLITVLLVYLMPTDDRKCRLEAERLATFLTATVAESIAHDGPMRAAFAFGAQTATREISRETAASMAVGFTTDDRINPFQTAKPVRFTTLLSAVGTINTGDGWIVFNGPRSRAAVVILELNEAVWSVVVPAGGIKEISVERGRAKLPGGATAPRRRNAFAVGSLPSLGGSGGPGLGSLQGGSLGGAVRGSPPIPALPEPLDPIEPDVVPDDLPDPIELPDPVPSNPVVPDVDDPIEDDPEEDPEEEPEEPECTVGVPGGCRSYYQCIPMPEGVDGAGYCQLDVSGLAVRLSSAQVDKPAKASEIMSPVFNTAILARDFNLVAKFVSRQGNGTYTAGIAQAVPTGTGYAASGELPSYNQTALPKNCTGGFEQCFSMVPATNSANNAASNIVLYVPDNDANGGQCGYYGLIVQIRIDVSLMLPKDEPEVSRAQIRLVGTVTNTAARKLRPYEGGPTLLKYFEDAEIYPNKWCRSPEFDDAYEFEMSGPAQFVDLFDTNFHDERQPPNCPNAEATDFCVGG
jgi:prepilin-type N-terminal cleavage/methylation domain-containing protein